MTVDDLVHVVAPPETRPPELLRAIAYHEGAHAVVSEALHVSDVQAVTLVPQGSSGGRCRASLKNAAAMSASQVDDLVVSFLAGRAADEMLGEAHSGAGGERMSDLGLATHMVASKMVSWGLGGSLLYRGDYSEVGDILRLDPALREAVRKELDRLYLRTLYVVRGNGRRIERVAQRLLQARVLSGEEVRQIIRDIPAEIVPTYVPPAQGGPHA